MVVSDLFNITKNLFHPEKKFCEIFHHDNYIVLTHKWLLFLEPTSSHKHLGDLLSYYLSFVSVAPVLANNDRLIFPLEAHNPGKPDYRK